MRDATRWLVLVIVLGSILAAFYYYWQQKYPLPNKAQPAPEAKIEPRIRHPIQGAEAQRAPQTDEQAKPLPPLNESDEATQDALSGLFGRKSVQEFFRLEDIVRRLVVTIDNLPRRQVPLRYMPVKPTVPRFLSTGEEENVFISPDNYRRYTPYVRLAEAVEANKLVAVYVHFYPLFQQAYQDLGYPSGYFNDRLVEVIDDLLATPDVQGPVKLVRPKVMYQFADPDLEARSAGQKILIRMGSENAARIKAKLQEIRRELTG
ncbi:MAG: DUF3014 domain-containing protein [Acidiferrobacterales bacterium]